MSTQKSNKEFKKITTHALQAMKERGEKISMLTAYDYSMATILDDAGIDILLVGDSASRFALWFLPGQLKGSTQ
jgi:hypothetical protein